MQHNPTWLWDIQILEIFDYLGIQWEVLPKYVRLDPVDQGSSPGDICWKHQVMLIEASCPEMWVVHDLAHWLVCKRDRPEMLQEQNYGHEGMVAKQIREDENITSDVNIAILKRLGIPHQKCADDINVIDDGFEDRAEPYLRPILAFLKPRG